MQTDTEVITYLFDHLLRHHNLPIDDAADVLTAPEWDEIDRMDDEKRNYFTTLRSIYSGALVNGPFSVILGSNKGLLAINDRLKLRSLTAAPGAGFYSAPAAVLSPCAARNCGHRAKIPAGGILPDIDRVCAA